MKQSPIMRFVMQLVGITAVLCGIAVMLSASGNLGLAVQPIVCIFGVLFSITSLSYYMVVKAATKSPRSFTTAFMLSSSLRLLIYGAFIALYCHLHKDVAMTFALTFFALYIIYTGFEIKSVLGFMKGK